MHRPRTSSPGWLATSPDNAGLEPLLLLNLVQLVELLVRLDQVDDSLDQCDDFHDEGGDAHGRKAAEKRDAEGDDTRLGETEVELMDAEAAQEDGEQAGGYLRLPLTRQGR